MKDTKDMRHQKSWTCSENIGPMYAGRLIPREVTLQIKGNYVALYSEIWAFSKSEQYMTSLAFMNEIMPFLSAK